MRMFCLDLESRKWKPTPVFLPGKSQGQRSLVGCRLWGRTESDTTEATQQQQQQSITTLRGSKISDQKRKTLRYGCRHSNGQSWGKEEVLVQRRKWQPTPVFLPGESQGQRSLVGLRLWGRTESDTTEVIQQQQQQLSTKGSSLNVITLVVKTSTYEFCGDMIQSTAVGKEKNIAGDKCNKSSKR